jgi:Sel1 repeat
MAARKAPIILRINTVLRRSKWFTLLACGFIAFSAKASEPEITLVQLEAGASDNATLLVGHWRKNSSNYGAVRDEHLVFHPDGTVDTWALTVAGAYEERTTRTATTRGRWRIEGKLLNIDWGDKQSSRPFFFHKGQLVLPNIPNARQYWDKIRSSESTTASVPRRDFNAPNPPTKPALRDAPPSNVGSKLAEAESDIAKMWQDYQESAPEDSVQVIQKSVDSGSAEAQFDMGVFNEFGFKSLSPDLHKAVEWYRKAANQGHVLAKQGVEDLSRSGAALSEFDTIKLDMRRMSRLQQRLSNDLDRMSESALEAIKSIRGEKK